MTYDSQKLMKFKRIYNKERLGFHPNNPYYKEAHDNLNQAVTMLCDRNKIPYSTVCKMNKLGLLDCARHHYFNGTDEELRKHNQFIIDYFYYQHQ